MKKVNILDVTLRDGSYAINFQFSCAQQRIITEGLANLGIQFLEIGHGQGLNASNPQNGVALHTDEEYLQTARSSLSSAKYGMFCIPGIARLEDVDRACDYGVSFLRIGTNVTEVDNSEPFVKRAKERGIIVATNYMKSYAVDPEYLAEQVEKSESYGADIAYVVDSAGCMTPDQIERTTDAIRKRSSISLGFHGHNNLGLALVNSLKATELGYEYIDCSLQGMGRSSGNTPTELFVIVAKRMGFDVNIDVKGLLKLSQKYVYPLSRKINMIDTMCGYTGFHTSYLRDVHKISGKYGVDPLTLIEKYTKIDQVHMDLKLLEDIAKTLPEDLDSYSLCDFIGYFGHEQA